MSLYRRTGVVYSLDEEGTARIIFSDNKDSFQGVFNSEDGDCNLFGRIICRGDNPSTSTVNVIIVESETGAKFEARKVLVEFSKNPNPIATHPYVTLKSDSIEFTTLAVFHGMRADVEIQEHMDPSMVETGRVVHLGRMSMHLSFSQRLKPPMRRESECVDCVNPKILEVSNDFLA